MLQVCQPEDGGVAEHVLWLSAGLVRRGWAVEAAVPPASAIRRPLADAGVVVHDVPMAREPVPADLAAGRALRALDHRRGYAIVHAHSSKAGALVRGVLRGRRRLVYTPHCFAFAATFGRARRLAYRAVEQVLVRRAGALLAVCEWEREVGERELRGTAGRLRTVYNGVPPCRDEPAASELLEFKGDGPLAGLVTVLRPQKDPLLAIQALAQLSGGGQPPGRLAIVGNGELASKVEAEIDRLGVDEHVRLFPYRPGVGRYLAALDLLVLPSAWEAFPLAVLEAMACEVPVLATRVGGIPEAVLDGRTGRLVPPGDCGALAQALGELLADAPGRERLGAEGRRHVAERFDVEVMVDQVAGVYDQLRA